MSHAIAPQTNITLNSITNLTANRAVAIHYITTLTPLMIKLSSLILRHNVFAIRFTQFGVSTEFMYDYSTFLAF